MTILLNQCTECEPATVTGCEDIEITGLNPLTEYFWFATDSFGNIYHGEATTDDEGVLTIPEADFPDGIFIPGMSLRIEVKSDQESPIALQCTEVSFIQFQELGEITEEEEEEEEEEEQPIEPDFQLLISDEETDVNNNFFRMNMVDTYFKNMYQERDIAADGPFYNQMVALNIQGIDHSGPSPAHYGHVIPNDTDGSGNKGYNGVISEIEGDGHSQAENEFEVYYEAFTFDFMEKAREFKLKYGCAADYEVNCMHGTVEETEWAVQRLEPEFVLICPESNLSAYEDYFPDGEAYERAAEAHIAAIRIISPATKIIIDADPNDQEWNGQISSMDADGFKIYWKPDRQVPWNAADFEGNLERLIEWTDTDFPANLDFLFGQFNGIAGAVTQRSIQIANAGVDVRNTMFECLGTLLYHQWLGGYTRDNPDKIMYRCEMNAKQLFTDLNVPKANYYAELLAGNMYGAGKKLRDVTISGLTNVRARAVRDGSNYYVLVINLHTATQTITGIKLGTTVYQTFDNQLLSAESLDSSEVEYQISLSSEGLIMPPRSGAVIQIQTA